MNIFGIFFIRVRLAQPVLTLIVIRRCRVRIPFGGKLLENLLASKMNMLRPSKRQLREKLSQALMIPFTYFPWGFLTWFLGSCRLKPFRNRLFPKILSPWVGSLLVLTCLFGVLAIWSIHFLRGVLSCCCLLASAPFLSVVELIWTFGPIFRLLLSKIRKVLLPVARAG